MKVFKFGGASANSTDRIKNLATILKKYQGEKLLVVISAMGKTTNALEKVVDAFYAGNREFSLQLFNQIKFDHISVSEQLKCNSNHLKEFFTEIEWLLHDTPVKEYDYYYDQIVCIGELLSTSIVSDFLNNEGILNQWMDVRDIIRTDDNFRNAIIDWNVTSDNVNRKVAGQFDSIGIVLTQGFIGATDENESTTLGREGSDYTAAIFANLLNAENLTIWKDVQGVMNADPKIYKEAQWISELNYREVIEMAYYGAQVIHPKTIKPIHNKNIPLYVRSFIHPDEKGTLIHSKNVDSLPPIIVYKEKQVLLQLTSRDYSFVGEGLSADIFELFEDLKFKPNLTQTAAISLLVIIDDFSDKVNEFAEKASKICDVSVSKDLTMLTIRHYTDELFQKLVNGNRIVLKQQTPETIQVIYKV
jgi:aspartate kinase